MADPVREQIIANVVSGLEGITTANGYEQDIEAVIRTTKMVIQVDERPAIMVVDRGDVKKRHIRLAYENTMTLELLALLHENDGDERVIELSRLHADVEKLVGVDETWGGRAFRTFMTGLNISQDDITAPYATTLTTMTILYRVQEKNPYLVRNI